VKQSSISKMRLVLVLVLVVVVVVVVVNDSEGCIDHVFAYKTDK